MRVERESKSDASKTRKAKGERQQLVKGLRVGGFVGQIVFGTVEDGGWAGRLLVFVSSCLEGPPFMHPPSKFLGHGKQEESIGFRRYVRLAFS